MWICKFYVMKKDQWALWLENENFCRMDHSAIFHDLLDLLFPSLCISPFFPKCVHSILEYT